MATAFADGWQKAGWVQRFFICIQFLLGGISLIATTWGFADLMGTNVFAPTNGLSDYISAILIGAISFSIIMAMLFGLITMLDRNRTFVGRLTGGLAYVLFFMWSVAFGYGFFWKAFASTEYTRQQFDEKIELIDITVADVLNSLTEVQRTVDAATVTAATEAESERLYGGSCDNAPNSPVGEGRLMRARNDFAEESGEVRDDISENWVTPLSQNALILRQNANAIAGRSLANDSPVPGNTAEAFDRFQRLADAEPDQRAIGYTQITESANQFVANANSYRERVGTRAISAFDQLIDQLTPVSEGGSAVCVDVELRNDISTARETLINMPEVADMEFHSTEGSAATQYAFEKFFKNVFLVIRQGLSSIGIGSEPIGDSVDAMGDDDIIALFATIAIDFALLIVSLLSRPAQQKRGPAKPPRWLRKIAFWRAPSAEDYEEELQEQSEKSNQEVRRIQAEADHAKSLAEAESKKQQEATQAVFAKLENEIEELKLIRRNKKLIAERKALLEDDPIDMSSFDLLREDQKKLKHELTDLFGNEKLAVGVALHSIDMIEWIDGHHYIAAVITGNARKDRTTKRFINFLMTPGFGAEEVPGPSSVHDEMLLRLNREVTRINATDRLFIFSVPNKFASLMMRIPGEQLEMDPNLGATGSHASISAAMAKPNEIADIGDSPAGPDGTDNQNTTSAPAPDQEELEINVPHNLFQMAPKSNEPAAAQAQSSATGTTAPPINDPPPEIHMPSASPASSIEEDVMTGSPSDWGDQASEDQSPFSPDHTDPDPFETNTAAVDLLTDEPDDPNLIEGTVTKTAEQPPRKSDERHADEGELKTKDRGFLSFLPRFGKKEPKDQNGDVANTQNTSPDSAPEEKKKKRFGLF